MTSIFKALVAAGVVAVAGAAHADIQGPNAGGSFFAANQSELVFSAWSDSAEVGFTWDVESAGFLGGIANATLLNIANVNPRTASTLTGTDTIDAKVSAVNGVVFDMKITGFDDFLAAAGNPSDIKFNVFAGSTDQVNTFVASYGNEVGALSGGIFQNVGNFFVDYVNNVNQVMAGTNAEDNYVITTSADGIAYAGSNAWGNAALYPGVSFNAALGESIDFNVVYGNSTVAPMAKSLMVDGMSLEVSTYLAADGYHMQIAQVAAVPEPETYAMLLAGLGMIGAIARRRRA